MEKSKIEIIIDSVMDGTIGIEQVWQNYGDFIRNTDTVNSEPEALALTGLYFRYAVKLDGDGYSRDARDYYLEAYNTLEKWKKIVSADQYNHSIEIILYSIANVNSKLDDYKSALPYLKQLKNMFPRKDDYRNAYINCLGSAIAKYTNPAYIVIAILFLLKIGESYLLGTKFIPGWLVDVGWIIWIIMLIVQFGLPWMMKRFMK